MNCCFITWYPTCRRSDTIARALGGKSFLVHYLGFKQPLFAPVKYVLQTIKTWSLLRRERPDVVFVASPPVFAVIAVWLYCAVYRRRFVVDAHTGLFDDPRWTWLAALTRRLSRAAISTIVTSEHLQDVVSQWRANSAVIGTVPVEFGDFEAPVFESGVHVVVVNTFSVDEPVDEVVKAAAILPQINFHVTGSLKHSRTSLSQVAPANLNFTGWLTEAQYGGLLRAADVVVCLTTHNHTMQRGAYEAMALSRPLVTSDWPILRTNFNKGTMFTDNSAADIASAIDKALAASTSLAEQMSVLANEQRQVFDANIKALRKTLSNRA